MIHLDGRVERLVFQFTHPGRGATERSDTCSDDGIVSIHAPREGCDGYQLPISPDRRKFQFTHPGRGATEQWQIWAIVTLSFNSRTPGGVRQYGAKLPIMGRINKRNLRLAVLL